MTQVWPRTRQKKFMGGARFRAGRCRELEARARRDAGADIQGGRALLRKRSLGSARALSIGRRGRRLEQRGLCSWRGGGRATALRMAPRRTLVAAALAFAGGLAALLALGPRGARSGDAIEPARRQS